MRALRLLSSALPAVLAAFLSVPAARPMDERELVAQIDRLSGPAAVEAIEAVFGAQELAAGTAVAQDDGRFLFVVRSAATPSLRIDDRPVGALKAVKGTDLWIYKTKLDTGRSHAIEYTAAGKPLGQRTDIRAYTATHYPRPGVAEGRLSDKQTHTSKVYPGMVSEWWYYLSPGVEPDREAPLMVWQDGQVFADRNSRSRLFTVTENLIADRKIPPMVHLMIAPGMAGEQRMRSIQYDTVTAQYNRFVLDEILPELEKVQPIRKDAYSRGIGGQSSGGIRAFASAWLEPDQFARVLSRIGSYTSIAWRSGDERGADLFDSGHSIPFLVRKGEKRNIRVWMEDGAMDLENSHGSWPLQNVQLANSLKMREYDFRFLFGTAQHNTAHGDSLLPEALVWLWRDYDPAKTNEEFSMDRRKRRNLTSGSNV